VLCVDDEAAVLGGFLRNLRRDFAVTTAIDGENALDVLETHGPFAVVMSDVRMPRMDGITFFTHAREVAPTTARVLLTGHAQLDTAIDAVNRGHVYRFLCKPTLPDEVAAALHAGVAHHEALEAARVSHEQTIRGVADALATTLSLTHPGAFARATRRRALVAAQASNIGTLDWAVDVAAMLSEIGLLTLPPDLVCKLDRGEPLNEHERAAVDGLPDVTERLLGNIPGFDEVRRLIREHHGDAQEMTLGARMLRLARDLDALEAAGHTRAESCEILSQRNLRYDRTLLGALADDAKDTKDTACNEREVAPNELTAGMVLARDVLDRTGVLLVGRGRVVTDALIELLRNHTRHDRFSGTLFVTLPEPATKPCDAQGSAA
jgi:ActR/RegA family two-component response regulator